MQKQLAVVRAALERAGASDVPVHGVLCFVDADWPLFGGAVTIADVAVLWPRRLYERLAAPGDLDITRVESTHHSLASALPVA